MRKESRTILKANALRWVSVSQVLLFVWGLVIIYRAGNDSTANMNALGAAFPFSIMILLELVVLILLILYAVKLRKSKKQKDMVAAYLMAFVIILYILATPIIKLVQN